MKISDPITLPISGLTIKNRLCKSAMTEGLCDEYARATKKHVTLYSAWAKGGCGLLVTGNVQIDRRYLERPGNVCIDGPQDEKQMQALRNYAKAAQKNGTKCFVQISHPGRQANIMVAKQSPAPSAIPIKGLMPVAEPFEMSNAVVKETIQKYVDAALVCKEAGFDGVQLHSAHGYLLSTFLNPLANIRSDEYGGPLENRAKPLLDTIRAVRQAVGEDFAVGVKINSSDFQKGGFTHHDAIVVAEWLDNERLDFIELSGGNYESPAMVGELGKKKSTVEREAYFLKYARDIKQAVSKTPLMVTGGFRSRDVMENALTNDGIGMIGLGRPLCLKTDCVNDLLEGRIDTLKSPETYWVFPWYLKWMKLLLGSLAKIGTDMGSMYWNLYLAGDGKPMLDQPNVLLSMMRTNIKDYQVGTSLKGLPLDDPTLQQNQPKSKIPVYILVVLLAIYLFRKMN